MSYNGGVWKGKGVRKDQGGGGGESKLPKGRVFYRWESSRHGGIR